MSLQEVLKIQKTRKNREKDIFDKIYDRVKIRINHIAKYGRTNCYYDIPQLMYGLPSVDLKDCGDYIQKKLEHEGFVVYRISEVSFLIDWNEASIEEQIRIKNRKLKEKKKKAQMDEMEKKRTEELMGFLLDSKK